jgi:hypothetical protein
MFDQLGLGTILGAMNGYNSGSPQNYTNNVYQSPLQQQYQYNSNIQNQAQPKWMFDGRVCDVRKMADMIWPKSCPEKTHFLLKFE